MLKSVEIFNFQSHEHTLVEFHAGINIISGTTDSGKSALMRAIRWVAKNQPNGLSIISWWAFRKNKQVEDSRVILTLDNGRTIERIRGEINGYIIDNDREHPLEAIGVGVPPQIEDILCLTDVNIQRQLDLPFLLADGAGEVARFFNKLVNMDESDIYQGLIETKRRKVNSDLAAAIQQQETNAKERAGYDWLEKAAPLIAKYERLNAENDTILSKFKALTITVTEYNTHQDILASIGDVAQAESICASIAMLTTTQDKQQKECAPLVQTIETYTSMDPLRAIDIAPMEAQTKKIFRILAEQADIRSKIAHVLANISSLAISQKEANQADREMFPLEQELALVDICPYCHHKLTEAPSF